MTETPLTLQEIYNLAYKTLIFNGCDKFNAEAVASTVTDAERDGSISHGLFRIPGYVAALKSKKAKGNSKPSNIMLSQNVIRVDGDYGFAPVAIKVGIPKLTEITNKYGVGVLTIANTHHFAALWHETEALANENLIGIACTAYKPSVAPAGAKKHCLELILFHLLGQEKTTLQLYTIWLHQQWQWVRFKLQHVMVTKYLLVRA